MMVFKINRIIVILCILGIALGDVSHLGYHYNTPNVVYQTAHKTCHTCGGGGGQYRSQSTYSIAPQVQYTSRPSYQQSVQRTYVQPVVQQQRGYNYSPPTPQIGYQYSPPTQSVGYQYSPPTQSTGYHYSPPQQSTGYHYSPPQQSTGYHYSPPQQSVGYHYNRPSRPRQLEIIAPAIALPPNRRYVSPIAAEIRTYQQPEAVQQNLASPLSARTVLQKCTSCPDSIAYKQAYVQPSVYQPPLAQQEQRSLGPPPDPYAYTPPKKQFITPQPQPQPKPQPQPQPQRTLSKSSVIDSAVIAAAASAGYHYDKPTIPFPPPPPPAPAPIPQPAPVIIPKTIHSGSLTSDGYHYDKPKIPFPVPQPSHIPAGTLKTDGYHYERPASVPSFSQVPAGSLTSDGYHYDKPEGGDIFDNGLHYRKIRRVIYRYKKK